jgi:tripartite-type tricarboxylate transporter receptor subunit TctC
MALTVSASAADYPSRTIRVIVPFAAGGSTDLMTRILAPAVSSRLGNIDIIVENRAGGGGAIAMMELVQSPADGYTLIMASPQSAVMTPILSDVGYSNEDLAPIALVSSLPTNIFVLAESEIKNMDDLLRLAGENYGRLTYSTSGTGSTHHIVGELFQYMAGRPGLLTHVPYTSGTESITAVLGGHVDMTFANASYGESYVNQQGILRSIATSAEHGCAIVPDTPTLRSLGYDVTIGSWWGFAARTGTPEEILNIVSEAVSGAMADPEVRQAMINIGMLPHYMNRADFTNKYSVQYNQLSGILADLFE